MLRVMSECMTIQGRRLLEAEIEQIRGLIHDNPHWHRTKLSKQLCALWDWRAANGQPKDMACRSMLRKLHDLGLIELPPARRASGYSPKQHDDVLHSTDPIVTPLSELQPIRVLEVRGDAYFEQLFVCLLSRYHYLGYDRAVGEKMRYLALDRQDRPLAALLFGSAAWKTRVRDQFIGWSAEQRERQLHYVTNNSRFLIVPWVRSKCLASCVLGASVRRLSDDWQRRYGHPIWLVESFVDRSRFAGTCYRAANWQNLGSTTGRTRQDRHHRIKVAEKDVYVYCMHPDFRNKLRARDRD